MDSSISLSIFGATSIEKPYLPRNPDSVGRGLEGRFLPFQKPHESQCRDHRAGYRKQDSAYSRYSTQACLPVRASVVPRLRDGFVVHVVGEHLVVRCDCSPHGGYP